ncbi:DNA gyrase subunit A, chloroplastic/mitochondrial, partial [Tanacetum coccineum]
ASDTLYTELITKVGSISCKRKWMPVDDTLEENEGEISTYYLPKAFEGGRYRYDMTVDEAAEVARRSIYHATFRDGSSGGVASAEAILDINLRRLTLLERSKYINEGKSLLKQICYLEELLSSKKQILQLIEQEASEIKNRFSTPRHSTLEDADNGTLDEMDVIPNEEMLLVT